MPKPGVEIEETDEKWEVERAKILKKITGKDLDTKIKLFRECFVSKEGVQSSQEGTPSRALCGKGGPPACQGAEAAQVGGVVYRSGSEG